MDEKDYVTIGDKLSDMIGLELSESDFKEFGKEFAKRAGDIDPHYQVKQIAFLERGFDILDVALCNIDKYSKSKPITIMEENAKCTIIIFNNHTSDSDSRMIRDLMEYTTQFILLTGVESRYPGAGFDLMSKVIDLINGRVPILLQAGCLYAGDYFSLKRETIRRNRVFYEALGFRDVNDTIGVYDNSVVMMYCDDELYNAIQ